MVFWRSRTAKKAEAPDVAEAEKTAETTPVEDAKPTSETASANARSVPQSTTESVDAAPQSNVVPLVKPRLADRLADVADRIVSKTEIAVASLVTPASADVIAGQDKAIASLRLAMASARNGEHLLLMGAPGTGRLSAGKIVAKSASRQKPDDWVYVVERGMTWRARALALPAGQGERFARDARIAVDKAAASLRRQLASDEYRLDLDLLNEELRFRAEKAIEGVRRRAEAQNIAVVKSLDGYVLAPMHEGRVVRSDVYHALPETLRRNVEAKITALETELQQTVAALPSTETHVGEKYEALYRETARRSLKPFASGLTAAYADSRATLAAIEAIEKAFVAWGMAFASGEADIHAVQIFALNGNEETSSGPAVVVAHEASAFDLVGRVSSDSHGRVAVAPGHLTRGSGGFVLVEAWKLAADPQAWMAMSAALTNSEVVPRCASRSAFEAEPLPLTTTVVLIADPESWAKINAIEPGAARHFQHVVNFASTCATLEVAEVDFGRSAARLAAENDLKSLEATTVPLLYKDAIKRGNGRVSLDRTVLLQTLREADRKADAGASGHVRAADIVSALAGRSAVAAP